MFSKIILQKLSNYRALSDSKLCQVWSFREISFSFFLSINLFFRNIRLSCLDANKQEDFLQEVEVAETLKKRLCNNTVLMIPCTFTSLSAQLHPLGGFITAFFMGWMLLVENCMSHRIYSFL